MFRRPPASFRLSADGRVEFEATEHDAWNTCGMLALASWAASGLSVWRSSSGWVALLLAGLGFFVLWLRLRLVRVVVIERGSARLEFRVLGGVARRRALPLGTRASVEIEDDDWADFGMGNPQVLLEASGSQRWVFLESGLEDLSALGELATAMNARLPVGDAVR